MLSVLNFKKIGLLAIALVGLLYLPIQHLLTSSQALVPTPTITNLSSDSGLTTGGEELTITGTSFFTEQDIEIVQVSAGGEHSLVLDTDGDIWAWGLNNYGQLGITANSGNTNPNPTPTRVNSSVKFEKISTSRANSAAIDKNGDIWVWGRNDYGQLGFTANSNDNPTPNKISSSVKFDEVSVGGWHMLAIDTSGDIWSWGYNSHGELGRTANSGTYNPNPTPAKITSSVKFEQISAGAYHSLAIDKSGDIWGWGQNYYGQLGITTNSGNNNPNPTPTKITSSVKFEQISARHYNSSALDASGDIWTWGLNQMGQLGNTTNNGNENPNSTPTKITSSEKFDQISIGYHFSLAIDKSGDIWAWGNNNYGQLGNTTNNSNDNPNPTPTRVESSVKYNQISSGGSHSLALSENNNIWAWGQNNSGQLGFTANSDSNPTLTEIELDLGTIIASVISSVKFGNKEAEFVVNSDTSISVITPSHSYGTVDITITTIDGQVVTLPNAYTYKLPLPEIADINPDHGPTEGGTEVEITGLNFLYEQGVEVAQLISNHHHSLVLDSEGNIWAWGRNDYGQLGSTTNNGNTNPNPTPTKINSSVSFSQIEAGWLHSLALDTNGDIWSWGYNQYGQLGTSTNSGTENPNPTLTKVASGTKFKQISAGNNHSLAIDVNGEIWAWGNNYHGELGNVTNNGVDSSNSTPTKIITSVEFEHISSGSFHSLALDINGDIWAWGYNNYGQLGITANSGNANPNPTPTKINSSVSFSQISANGYYTSALDTDGNIWSWGSNYYGQLGSTANNNTTNPNPTPTKINSSVSFSQVVAGGYHALALDVDGAIWSWGLNNFGQLGNTTNNGTTNPNPTPIKIVSDVQFDKISAGYNYSLALGENDDIWTWGINNYGQLGNMNNIGADTPSPTPTELSLNYTVNVVDSITFDSTDVLSFTINSPTSITVFTPPHSSGIVDVSLVTLDNQTVTEVNGYTYEYEDEAYINLSIDNSELNIDITPNLSSINGVVSSASHIVSFTSNRPLIDLFLNTNEAHSNLVNLTDDTRTISSTLNTLVEPGILAANTWGFAIEDRALETNKVNSSTTWAKVPNINESPTLLKSTTMTNPANETTPIDTNVFYGAKVNSNQLAGYYATTIIYTAVESI